MFLKLNEFVESVRVHDTACTSDLVNEGIYLMCEYLCMLISCFQLSAD